MKILHKLFGNSFLMMVLFAMLFLPIGAMGFATVSQNQDTVLSITDTRTEDTPLDTTPQTVETQDQTIESTAPTSDLAPFPGY